MSGTTVQSQRREEKDRRKQQPAPTVGTSSSPGASPLPPKSSPNRREGTPADSLGLPLASLLREPQESILPPPSDALRKSLAASSPHRSPNREVESKADKEKEDSFDSPRGSPPQRSESPIDQSIFFSPKRDPSFPDSPFRSQLQETENAVPAAPPKPPPEQKENVVNSPGREGAIVVANLGSLLQEAGSPISQPDGSPTVVNRMAVPAAPAAAAKVGDGLGKRMRVDSGVVRRAALTRAEVGLRVSEAVLCLVSFSVMAADKTSGWAGDSFDRYPEFRFCLSINVIAFAYSGFQVYAHVHRRINGRRIISRPLNYYFDFGADQILAYLLMSASSSAATRNDVWTSMFGRDDFTDMMNGSVAISFLAFLAFGVSSIISAHKLFSWSP
ncbi:CASP-like protein [Apostasia shenzhenica]|uniref:CASP-like protein n=1 Tax=Apostasia shenzhenica TaxID=1088818 RepID=A0A2I0B1P2_9ASPA|nr:CASP-like protein [Apostasia shenzhenica]